MPAKVKRTTQADVAKLAGVSQSTVSMVLNQRNDNAIPLSQNTIDKVYQAMETLGYAPDPVAQMLAVGQSNLLGLFSYDRGFSYADNAFYHNILGGVELAADRHNYNMLLLTAQGATSERRIFQRGVNMLALADGAILIGSFPDYGELRRLSSLGYPFVYVGKRELPDTPLNWVVSDYAIASAQATEHLIAYRHRNIAYLCSTRSLQTVATRERLAACRSVIDSINGAVLTVIEQDAVQTPESLHAILTNNQITALLCDDAAYFNQAMTWLPRLNIRVPQDLSILSLGDTLGSFATALPATHVRLNHRKVGETAGETLIGLLNHELTSPQQRLVECEFVAGETTRPLR